ncbi:hypothetical protein, partial [Helicobacter pylori]|uniref:hypothetical protein n=1 Tax=Helicobacter pylori TaxID=210 RepID=UPI002927CDAA
WAGLFAEHGYQPSDCIRPAVWGDDRVAWWYQQNTLLYRKGAPEVTTVCPLDIAHPVLVASRENNLDHMTLRDIMRSAPGALRRSLRH